MRSDLEEGEEEPPPSPPPRVGGGVWSRSGNVIRGKEAMATVVEYAKLAFDVFVWGPLLLVLILQSWYQ